MRRSSRARSGDGWFERDYDEFGYEFGTAPERLRALARDLPLMKQRLTKGNPPAIGPLGDTLALADGLADAGVAEITMRTSGPDYDLGGLREAIQWRDRYNAQHR